MNTKLLISATAAAAFAVNVHAAGVVTTGDLNTIDKWYGRAGGPTTADVAARTTRRVVKMPWVCPTRSRMPRLSLQEDRQLSELA